MLEYIIMIQRGCSSQLQSRIDYADNISKITRKNIQIQQQNSRLQYYINSLKKQNQQLQEDKRQLQILLRTNSGNHSKPQNCSGQNETSCSSQNEASLQEKLRAIKQKNYEMQDKYTQLQKEYKTLQNQNKNILEKNQYYSKQIEQIKNEKDTCIRRYQNLKAQSMDTNNGSKQKQKQILEQKRELQNCNKTIYKIQQELRKKGIQIQQLQRKYLELQRFAIQRSEIYQDKIIRDKNIINGIQVLKKIEKMNQNTEKIMQIHYSTTQRNREVKNYRELYSKLQYKMKQLDQMISSINYQFKEKYIVRYSGLTSDINTLKCTQRTNLQQQIALIKTVLHGFCINLRESLKQKGDIKIKIGIHLDKLEKHLKDWD